MSDSASLAERLYGPVPVSGGPNQQMIDAGKAVTTVAPRPITAADAIFGPGGPAQGGPVGPTGHVAEGVAKPAPEPDRRPQPPPAKAESAVTNQVPAQPFDPTNLKIEGFEADPALMGEFTSAAKELRLDHAGAEKLVAMHTRAMQARDQAFASQVNGWADETERHFGDDMPRVAAEIRDAIGSDRDAKEFFKLMDWSGLGNNASVIRILQRLAQRY